MQHFGIIGNPLTHSASPMLFESLFQSQGIDADYQRFELPSIQSFPALVADNDLSGLNVTAPYKEQVIPYLDDLSDTARAIGAVNVICFRGGKRIGHNTDCIGFLQSLQRNADFPITRIRHALILGTGGAAKAVRYALQQVGITYQLISRNPLRGLTYDQLDDTIVRSAQLIVNATPLGLYPHTDAHPPFPYYLLTAQHLCYDLIYNPPTTAFLQAANQQGAHTKNGSEMFHLQAEAAFHLWQ